MFLHLRKNNSGFTIVELLLITLLLLITVLFLASCAAKIRKAYEDELKINLKFIQTALERYASDHNGYYPQYILGGDLAGWDIKTGCETIITRPKYAPNIRETNLKNGGPRPPEDPLVAGGYIESYPENPFMKDFKSRAPEFSGGVAGSPGTGDVRFGFSGTIMGNVLDDPRFLWQKYPVFNKPEITKLQPTRLVNTLSQTAYMRNFTAFSPENEINPFYSIGGIPDPNNTSKTIHRWWPGQFFYRATGEMKLHKNITDEMLLNTDALTIWDFEIEKYDRYILGAYADRANTGNDLIRLTTADGTTIDNRSGPITDYYRRPKNAPFNENIRIYMSPPEIFGGGNKGIAPFFPYYDDEGDFIYGSPDGYPDGVITPVLIDRNNALF